MYLIGERRIAEVLCIEPAGPEAKQKRWLCKAAKRERWEGPARAGAQEPLIAFG